MTDLVRKFDTFLFDLDGVIYLGPHAVPHAAQAVAELHRRGARCAYVTNNAFRTPSEVAEHLTDLGFLCSSDDVITSPQAALTLLRTFVPDGSRVLVIGGPGISQTLTAAGYVPVTSLEHEPVAVVQGYSPDLSWRDLAEASFAVAAGLPWIATNPDLTFPTPRGIAPGNGSLIQAVANAAGRSPDAIAGKPEPPLLHEALTRTGARSALMVGDRLDTDIAAGIRVGVSTLLVLTGVTTLRELVTARESERPDFVGSDLRVLLKPYPQVVSTAEGATCGHARAWVRGGAVGVEGADFDDALRACLQVAWGSPESDVEPALEKLAELAGSVSDVNREEHDAE